jgi:hypothetical protein
MNKFIFEIPNSISNDICRNIIDRFHKDNSKTLGAVEDGILDITMKNTMDLHISNNELWKDIDSILCNKLKEGIELYENHLILNNINVGFLRTNHIIDTGYNIKSYKQKEGYYHWHHDNLKNNKLNMERCYTFMWYLNTVNDGGETEFIDGTKIKAETGKLLFFPACKTFIHRGLMPVSDNKYICGGWIYTDIIFNIYA